MNLIIYTIFIVLIALLIAQVGYVIGKVKKNRKNEDDYLKSVYSTDVLEHGKKSMQAVRSGEIKKQLIENDAPLYNSARTLQQYSKFIEESTIFKKILVFKESRYNG
nr:hypothetical protein [uncultured Acetatifactor sp.]